MQYSAAMAPKTASTFRIEDKLLAALHAVKERDGIPISEQVRRALEMWLELKGVKTAPRRAVTRRKA